MKTKQCFCQSIYNGETKQVENCACGKCSLAINPVPTQITSNKRDSLRKILGELIELIHKYPMESEADLIDIVVNKYGGKNEN